MAAVELELKSPSVALFQRENFLLELPTLFGKHVLSIVEGRGSGSRQELFSELLGHHTREIPENTVEA